MSTIYIACDYDFGYDDKALFEKTYCYSAYEAFGVPSPLTEVETPHNFIYSNAILKRETRLGASNTIREFILPGRSPFLVRKSPID